MTPPDRPYHLTLNDKNFLRRLRIAQDDDGTPAAGTESEPSSTGNSHGPAEQ